MVSVDWLSTYEAPVVLTDVRHYLDGRSGQAAYRSGHLPGAVFVDMDRWLAARPSAAEGRHPLPPTAVFAEGMSSLGIGNSSTVVAYDDAGGVMAARLVWMLRVLGIDAALLDGGIGAWPGALSLDIPEVTPAAFTATDWPADALADIDDACDPSLVVIDARPADRFRGENDTLDVRAGHIPGARSVPCRENLDAAGRFLPLATLREHFKAAGVTGKTEVVSYCGSGVTACHNLLAMEHAGLGSGRLYPGSWSAYAATDRELERS